MTNETTNAAPDTATAASVAPVAPKQPAKAKPATAGKGKGKAKAKGKGKAKAPIVVHRPRQNSTDLCPAILKAMPVEKPQTTRDVVLKLGRQCGKREGGPVLAALYLLLAERAVRIVPNASYPGHTWVRVTSKGRKAVAAAKAKQSAE